LTIFKDLTIFSDLGGLAAWARRMGFSPCGCYGQRSTSTIVKNGTIKERLSPPQSTQQTPRDPAALGVTEMRLIRFSCPWRLPTAPRGFYPRAPGLGLPNAIHRIWNPIAAWGQSHGSRAAKFQGLPALAATTRAESASEGLRSARKDLHMWRSLSCHWQKAKKPGFGAEPQEVSKCAQTG
jgi:hypothetical protein